jgi:hypothetical protein
MSKQDYWEETIEIAASECGLSLTEEQIKYLGAAAESSHDNYGMAFYSPPASDRIHAEEREWERRYKLLDKEFEAYRNNAEHAVKKALNCRTNDSVGIGEYGKVTLYDGRHEVIQW